MFNHTVYRSIAAVITYLKVFEWVKLLADVSRLHRLASWRSVNPTQREVLQYKLSKCLPCVNLNSQVFIPGVRGWWRYGKAVSFAWLRVRRAEMWMCPVFSTGSQCVIWVDLTHTGLEPNFPYKQITTATTVKSHIYYRYWHYCKL